MTKFIRINGNFSIAGEPQSFYVNFSNLFYIADFAHEVYKSLIVFPSHEKIYCTQTPPDLLSEINDTYKDR